MEMTDNKDKIYIVSYEVKKKNRSSGKCDALKYRMFKRHYTEIWHMVVILGIFEDIKSNLYLSYVSLGLARDYITALMVKHFIKKPIWVKGS